MSYADKIIDQIFNVDKTMQASGARVVIGEAVVAQHAVKVAKEADAEIAQLRQRVTELEGQCAAMRGALGKAEYEAQSFVTAFERGQIQNRHRDGSKAALNVIRQALQATTGAKEK